MNSPNCSPKYIEGLWKQTFPGDFPRFILPIFVGCIPHIPIHRKQSPLSIKRTREPDRAGSRESLLLRLSE